jgi:hypothetical protein
MASNIIDTSDLTHLNFKFKDGDDFVEDEQRNQALKHMIQPTQKVPKLPPDYQVDMDEVLKPYTAIDLSGDGGVMKYLVSEVSMIILT